MHERSREGRFVLDGAYRIVEWDDAAAAMFEVPRDEALGRSCSDVVTGALAGAAPCRTHCPVRHQLKRGRARGTATRQGTEGDPSTVRCRLTALPGADGGAVGSLRITPPGGDAKGAAGDGLDSLHALAAFASLATEISSGSLARRLDTALERIRTVLEADATEAFLLEPGNGDVVLTAHAGGNRRAFEQKLRFAPHEGVPGRVAAKPGPLILDHLAGDARYLRDQVVAAGFQAYACVPLPGATGPIGTLAAAFRRPPADLSRHAAFLGWSAPVVASAVQAALAEQSTGRWTGSHDGGPDGAIEAALLRLVAAVEADGADLILRSDRAQGVPMQAIASVGTPLPGRCNALRGSGQEECCAVRTGTPQLLAGDSTRWPPACRRATQRGGVRTCVPLELGPGRQALLRVWRAQRGRVPLTRGLVAAELSARAIERLIGSRWSTWPAGPNGHNGDLQQNYGSRAGLAAHEVRCFGTFEIRLDGAQLAFNAFRRRQAATLLKILLLHGDETVDRDVLLEAIWPGADPARKASQLHVLAHELRRVLASVAPAPDGEDPPLTLESVNGGYRLRVANATLVDLHFFERSRASADAAMLRGDADEAVRQAELATGLYRGALFADERYAEWCWAERERLHEACQELHTLAARVAGQQADWPTATRHWRAALQLDPLREDVRRGLMRSLWHEGKRDQALEQFRRCEALLQRELGVAPLAATLALLERIRSRARP